tara:strand:- start:220 stop:612 length:393 start_codon:yes stop_codon:yes gene_type:complete
MSQVANARPVYQKGQTPPKAPPKRMKRTTKPRDVCEPGQMFVSNILRKFAEGKECQMKSEWCSGDNETTAFCHSRRRAGAGANQKPHDFWGYHGCSECHAHEDRVEDRELLDAIRRTQYAIFEHFGGLTP